MKEVYEFIQEDEDNLVLNPLNGKVGLLLFAKRKGKDVKYLHELSLKLKS